MNAFVRPTETTGAGTDPSPMESPALARQNVQAPVSIHSEIVAATGRPREQGPRQLRVDAEACDDHLPPTDRDPEMTYRLEVCGQFAPATWQSRLIAKGLGALVLGCLLLAAYVWWRLLQ